MRTYAMALKLNVFYSMETLLSLILRITDLMNPDKWQYGHGSSVPHAFMSFSTNNQNSTWQINS